MTCSFSTWSQDTHLPLYLILGLHVFLSMLSQSYTCVPPRNSGLTYVIVTEGHSEKKNFPPRNKKCTLGVVCSQSDIEFSLNPGITGFRLCNPGITNIQFTVIPGLQHKKYSRDFGLKTISKMIFSHIPRITNFVIPGLQL